jgi:hypothetical protein
MKRSQSIVVGGVLGGIAFFAWGAISHMALGLTDRYMKGLPEEGAQLSAWRDGLKQPGLYMFPGAALLDAQQTGTNEQQNAAMQAWAADYARGPRGLLVYEPAGAKVGFAGLFLTQFGIAIAVGLLAAFVLAMAAPALPVYGRRVLFVALLGLFASVLIDLPYWNWYSFPTGYTVAYFFDHVVGMTVAGLVIARFVKA